MLIVDDILTFPVKSVLWLFRELHHKAQEDQANMGTAITQELSELYMMLETGQISESEFDARESILLDRLDAFNEQMASQRGE